MDETAAQQDHPVALPNNPVVVEHDVPGLVVLVEQSLMTQINGLHVRMGQAPVVTDKPSMEIVRAIGKDAKKLHTAVEKARKAVKQPFLDGGRKVDAAAAGPLGLLEEIIEECKAQIAEYDNDVKARGAAHYAQAAAMAQQAPADGYTQAPVAFAAPEVLSGAPTHTYRDVELVDANLIPREWLVPDWTRIRQAALAGTEIPGVRVVEKTTIAMR